MAIFDLFVPSGADGAAVTGSATGITFNLAATNPGTLLYDRTGIPLQPPANAHLITTTASWLKASFATAVVNAGMGYVATCPAWPPTAAVTYIARWDGPPGTARIGDLRINEFGQPIARDNNTAKTPPTNFALQPGQPYRAYIRCQVGSATGHQIQLFVGSNIYGTVPDYDSGVFTATGQVLATTVGLVGVGPVTAGGPVDVLIGRIRQTDDGTDPGSGYTAVPAAPNVAATSGNNAVTLSWTAAVAQTGCAVYRSTAQNSGYAALAAQPAATAATYTDSTATNGTAYFYIVTLANASGSSPRSAPANATPLTGTSQTLYPATDVVIAGCAATGSRDATMAGAINELNVPDPTNFITIQPRGHYQTQLNALGVPLPGGTAATIRYQLGPNQANGCVMSLYAGTTLVASDVPRSAPGTYTWVLTGAPVAALTGTDVRLDLLDTSP